MRKYLTFSRYTILTLSVWMVYLLVNYFGELQKVAANGTCLRYLGCVNGFFGYDAVEHLLGGVVVVMLIVWLCKKFPRYSILQEQRWKTVLFLVACVALVGVVWETIEFTQDSYFLYIVHAPILDYHTHLNLLAQPTNADTVGDSFFSTVGGLVAAILLS